MNTDRAYRILMRAYPLAFRQRFAGEMMLAFRDQRRASGRTGLRFWAATIWDITRSASLQRADSWRQSWETSTLTEIRTMKPMAIVAILIGAFEVVNALAEGVTGGLATHDTRSLAAAIVGVVAGALLIGAGTALLRRAPAAEQRARRFAVACIGLLVLAVLLGRLSIMSIVLGVVFPIGLLVFLRGARPPRSPAVS
jgi:hypothetical protein